MPATETLPRSNISAVSAPPETPQSSPRRTRRRLVAALAAVVAAAGIAAALVLTGGPDRLELGKPRIVSSAQLSSYAESAGRPIYWAGETADGYELELTEVAGQRTYVRYLTSGAKAGDPRPAFTTVATYPVKGAHAQLTESSSRPGSVETKAENGALVLYYRKAPSNVYVAHPGSDQLVEVYAPEPSGALQLAKSPLLTTVR